MSYISRKPFLPANGLDRAGDALADQDMLEFVLNRALSRRESRRLALVMLARFGSFADAIAAPTARLAELEGMTSEAIGELKFVAAAVQHFTRETMRKRLPLGSLKEAVEYCRVAMAFEPREMCRVLFLDNKNGLIADEVQGVGTVDHVPLYPREVIRRVLELSASAIILAHNHPSGDPMPSARDIRLTQNLIAVAQPFAISLRDHIVIARGGHASMRGLQLI